MEKRLIINADDFGLSPSINRGIIEAFEVGSISSATLMANTPGFEDAVEHIYRHSKLGIGMHFNLTYGSPINPPECVPSLVNAHGEFAYQLNEKWEEQDILLELMSQWECLIKAGLNPTHIDSHQHIQMYPNVYKQMVLFASSNHLCMRKTIFDPIIGMERPKSVDYFIMDIYFEGDGISRLEQHLRNLKPGITELMCHPGYVDSIVEVISDWTYVREIECHVFTQPSIKRLINELGIKLISYKDV
ncbi:carbohydrate deacetylase [Bacillus thuringiensis]|uniref:carbohydrate deacetylase n=1 Tax=Bacillus thuringiensis TaxID=1428 RepID=UPI00333B7FD0